MRKAIATIFICLLTFLTACEQESRVKTQIEIEQEIKERAAMQLREERNSILAQERYQHQTAFFTAMMWMVGIGGFIIIFMGAFMHIYDKHMDKEHARSMFYTSENGPLIIRCGDRFLSFRAQPSQEHVIDASSREITPPQLEAHTETRKRRYQIIDQYGAREITDEYQRF